MHKSQNSRYVWISADILWATVADILRAFLRPVREPVMLSRRREPNAAVFQINRYDITTEKRLAEIAVHDHVSKHHRAADRNVVTHWKIDRLLFFIRIKAEDLCVIV